MEVYVIFMRSSQRGLLRLFVTRNTSGVSSRCWPFNASEMFHFLNAEQCIFLRELFFMFVLRVFSIRVWKNAVVSCESKLAMLANL